MQTFVEESAVPTRYWHRLSDGRIQCDVCPRACKLQEGKRGLCFVRANRDGQIVLTTYGRSSGFCIDPVEKKPLNHFLPGTPASTLRRARRIAMKNGIRYAYTGNVHDEGGGSTYCHRCGTRLIGRDWYEITEWNLTDQGHCPSCGAECAGVLEAGHGDWGARRQPVRLASCA